jgi:hypothetical protein
MLGREKLVEMFGDVRSQRELAFLLDAKSFEPWFKSLTTDEKDELVNFFLELRKKWVKELKWEICCVVLAGVVVMAPLIGMMIKECFGVSMFGWF